MVLDRDHKLLDVEIARDEQWRFPEIDSIPYKYKVALIEYEDKRFYDHVGIDPFAILRAMRDNFNQGRVVSGASTITMQVIRLSRKNQPRTFWEKSVESLKALRLEMICSKEEILNLYASYAPYGGNVVGLEAASHRYFRRAGNELSWAEAATLAVLPNAPALIHPGKNREALLDKRNRLLDSLQVRGYLNSLENQLAKLEPLPDRPSPFPNNAPHLIDRIKSEHNLQYRRNIFYTTLKEGVQKKVSNQLKAYSGVMADQHIHNGAVLVLDNSTGEVLAYVGNTPGVAREHSAWVDIINSPRSTGSTLKPLLFALMLQNGYITPSSLVSDIPTRFGGYQPLNFDKKYKGVVSARTALARSLNVPAVRMLKQFGVDAFYDNLIEMGMTTLFRTSDNYGLSLILGGAEGSLWEISSMYASMAHAVNTYGKAVEQNFRAHYLHHEKNKKGRSRKERFPIDPVASYLTLKAMLEVSRPESEVAWRQFSSSQKIAWKTGTSYGFRDAWALGINKKYTVGVWIGNADGEGRPGLTGYQAAAPLLFRVFDQLKSMEWFDVPEADLREVEICSFSGYKSGPLCKGKEKVLSHIQSEKVRVCPFHQIVHLDLRKKWQVHAGCENLDSIQHVNIPVLSPAQEYYYSLVDFEFEKIPPLREDCRMSEQNAVRSMEIIYPQHHSKIYIPRELSGKKGDVILEVAHRNPESEVFWHLNGELIGQTREIHQLVYRPQEGRHHLSIVDEQGETLSRNFEIIYK